MRRFFISISLLICTMLNTPLKSFTQAASMGSTFININLTALDLHVVSAMDVAVGGKSGVISSGKLQAFASSVYLSHNNFGVTGSLVKNKREIQMLKKPASFKKNCIKVIREFDVIRKAILKTAIQCLYI